MSAIVIHFPRTAAGRELLRAAVIACGCEGKPTAPLFDAGDWDAEARELEESGIPTTPILGQIYAVYLNLSAPQRERALVAAGIEEDHAGGR